MRHPIHTATFAGQLFLSMNKPVIIIGGTTLGKVALEIFQSNGVVVYGLLDDKIEAGTMISEVPVLGKTDDEQYLKLIGKKCDVFVATDDNRLKENTIEDLQKERNSMPVNAIHASAMLAASVEIHHGNMIGQRVALGAHCKIGNHCLIHAGAVLEAEAEVEDFAQIGAGTVIGQGAKIGKKAFVGTGVTVVGGVQIAPGARVGAGAVVVGNVNKGETVFGNPAQKVKS